jgi:hypothetical protein
MDRELVLKELRKVLALGQEFFKGLDYLRTYDQKIEKEIKDLIEDGDEEFTILNNDFMQLFNDLRIDVI